MDQKFQRLYSQLNSAQKQAVDTIDGPVLVIAGPGTGKTQLLSLRIANILRRTDTLPENILCLTFTDAAATNMRERLTTIIGPAAYDVTISTYHAFGSDLLRRYPEYFMESADLRAADDLTIDTTFRNIMSRLPFSNPLKHEVFLRDVRQLISDAKRADLAPADLARAALQNQAFIDAASKHAKTLLAPMKRIDKQAAGLFAELLTVTTPTKKSSNRAKIVPLAELWHSSLEAALTEAETTGKTSALTKWKNDWLAKDNKGGWCASGSDQNKRLQAAAEIFELYLKALEIQELFDYDDMILKAIRGLENNPDLRFTLQERYQYLLLDEFQDTNRAQDELVQLLTDNPASEGRPNVLAVGDDDQAIFTFQGAHYSHMLAFYERYRETLVVTLTKNYRSHHDILQTAGGVSQQIQTRLHHNFPKVSKDITAANTSITGAIVQRQEFKSEVSQNAWVAAKIAELIGQGTAANEIAVLAPKHQYLEAVVPFLQHNTVTVHYEKRENVFNDPAIAQLLVMSRVTLALQHQDLELAASLWPEVLSFAFWQLPTSLVWQLSWEVRDEKLDWTKLLLENTQTRAIALFFIRLSQLAATASLEQMLDILVGTEELGLGETDLTSYRSPFYDYYFEPLNDHPDSQGFWQLLSNLTVLRARLREYKVQEDIPLTLPDLLEFVSANAAAEIKLLNTNPYQESTNAVELLTSYKAKGQEFGVVFILAAIDEVWGSKSANRGSRLSLPQNLLFIRYSGASEDERLRLLYVAMTRAKSQLYITSYTNTYAGKATTRLKYLAETTDGDETTSPLLPRAEQRVLRSDTVIPEIAQLTINWQQRHYDALQQPSLRDLLEPRLRAFRLSATQLNTFLDAAERGPERFMLQSLLCFPSASHPTAQYGNAVHETLHWLHMQNARTGTIPSLEETKQAFTKRLQAKRLLLVDYELLLQRGLVAVATYLQQRKDTIAATNYAEYSFRNENVFVGEAHLNGNIDKLIIDQSAKTMTIVDYKTGKSHSHWESVPKLHFYQNQLYFYKLLVEQSRTFKGYKVIDAYLEFVEPNSNGLIQELHLNFDEQRQNEVGELIQKTWKHIMDLSLPNIANYAASLNGIKAFEQDLLEGNV